MPRSQATHPTVAILTDFGYRDHYVGVMKGVIASICPRAVTIDITHGIPPQQVFAGALALRESFSFLPRRTVFLAVVDPGVGTDRKAIAVETASGFRFVGPDNGLLWLAAAQAQIKKIVELTEPRYRLPKVSASFHGRDIFAPAAAWLSRGVRIEQLGRRLESMIRLDPLTSVIEKPNQLEGKVVYIDGFGNLITNISRATFERFAGQFRQCRLSVRIQRCGPVPLHRTYAEAPRGAPLALFGSFDLLEIAVRDGNAATHFGLGVGTRVSIRAAVTKSKLS